MARAVHFLAVDPLEGGSANTYDYAGQNPVTNLDLSGESYFDQACLARLKPAGRNPITGARVVPIAKYFSCYVTTRGPIARAVSSAVRVVYRVTIDPERISRFAQGCVVGIYGGRARFPFPLPPGPTVLTGSARTLGQGTQDGLFCVINGVGNAATGVIATPVP